MISRVMSGYCTSAAKTAAVTEPFRHLSDRRVTTDSVIVAYRRL